MSDRAIAAAMVDCASRARWFVSNETLTPALRAVSIAAKQAARAVSEIAIEMPEQ